MEKSNKDFFWPSYVDLMTVLFVVMLVMFVLSYIRFKGQEQENISMIKELNIELQEKKKLDEIKDALARLEGNYFTYNETCKRHELKGNINFQTASAKIEDRYKSHLLAAGRELKRTISNIKQDGHDIKYLIVVEGRAARYKDPNDPRNRTEKEFARDLSYKRALSLLQFWENAGLDFSNEQFEIIAAGSGFEGSCRFTGAREGDNKRFIIQILPKIGVIKPRGN